MAKTMIIRVVEDPEEAVIKILREFNRPLSTNTLSILTDIPTHKIDKIMNRLARWGVLYRTTASKVSYWRLKQESMGLIPELHGNGLKKQTNINEKG